MQDQGDRKAVVVAMESGAFWPRWLGNQLTHNPNLFCAVQQGDDEPSSLPRHVDKLAKELETTPYSVGLAVLLFGSGERDVDERIQTALSLSSTLTLDGSGELVLVGARRSRSSNGVLRIAQLVAAHLKNPLITVRTLFLPRAQARGLRRALPAERVRATG